MSEIKLLPCFNPECKCKEIYMHKAVVCGKEIFFAECENDWCAMHGQAKDTEKEAIEAWNSLPRHLTWTTEPPEVQGWYWWRWDRYSESYPLEVRDGLIVEHPRKTLRNSSDISGEWAGPIPLPMEYKR